MLRATSPVRRKLPNPASEVIMGMYEIQRITRELENTKAEYEAKHEAMLKELQQKHEEHMAQMENHIKAAHEKVSAAMRMNKGERGTDGKSIMGPKGEKGDKGADGKNGRDGKSGRDGINGKDGKNATPEDVVAHIIEKKALKVEHIQGLREEVNSYRAQLAGKRYGHETMVRGGGDTVAAGTGVTITTANGVKTISASSSGVTIETPTGTVDGTNTTFTPTSKPKFVVSDGTTYFENAGYTWDGTHITMSVAPSQYIRDAI